MHLRLAFTLASATAMVLPSLNGFDLEAVFGESALLSHDNRDVQENNKASSSRSSPAPLVQVANAVPNRYIVVFNDDVSQEEIASHTSWVSSLVLSEQAGISDDEKKNRTPSLFTLPSIAGYSVWFTSKSLNEVQNNPVQDGATWGISRLSSRENDGQNNLYIHDPSGGNGVTAYVIDTGVKVADDDFEDRATYGSAVAFPYLKVDLHGHGSHVAGTIGSRTWGVAKSVEIVAVGVMGPLGTGLTSDIIKGLEFAGSTVNMSIGGGASDALDAAVNAATNAGLHVVVAAGNDNKDACEYSPARASGPITVGATDSGDNKADFSNFGKCVDIHAPGVDIESIGLLTSPTTMSGTSMASPHITGLVSYFLSLQPGLGSEFNANLIKPSDFKSKLIKYGTQNIIKSLPKDTVNVLAYNGGENTTEIWEQ
ncbi:hypothetical protein CJJ09_004512 [Candidozyma auris]|nr:hypothetical protein CJJ09_004512 [[Candida] auris]